MSFLCNVIQTFLRETRRAVQSPWGSPESGNGSMVTGFMEQSRVREAVQWVGMGLWWEDLWSSPESVMSDFCRYCAAVSNLSIKRSRRFTHINFQIAQDDLNRINNEVDQSYCIVLHTACEDMVFEESDCDFTIVVCVLTSEMPWQPPCTPPQTETDSGYLTAVSESTI